MLIDQNKILKKSKSLTGGFKGVVPKLGGGKRTPLVYFRMFIGIMLTVAFVAGTIILFWNLLSVGKSLSQERQNKKTEYIELIYNPKNK